MKTGETTKPSKKLIIFILSALLAITMMPAAAFADDDPDMPPPLEISVTCLDEIRAETTDLDFRPLVGSTFSDDYLKRAATEVEAPIRSVSIWRAQMKNGDSYDTLQVGDVFELEKQYRMRVQVTFPHYDADGNEYNMDENTKLFVDGIEYYLDTYSLNSYDTGEYWYAYYLGDWFYPEDLMVQNIPVTYDNDADVLGGLDEGSTVVYDVRSKTLKLNNAHINVDEKDQFGAFGIYSSSKLHVELSGENTINIADASDAYAYGIFGLFGTKVTGDGSLDISLDGTENKVNGSNLYGLYSAGPTSVKDAKVSVHMSNAYLGMGSFGEPVEFSGNAVFETADDNLFFADVAQSEREGITISDNAILKGTINNGTGMDNRAALTMKDNSMLSLYGSQGAVTNTETGSKVSIDLSQHNYGTALISTEADGTNRRVWDGKSDLGVSQNTFIQIPAPVKVPAADPTTKKAGNIEYYYDPLNGTYSTDPAGNEKIDPADTVIPKLISITNAKVKLSASSFTYNGNARKPTVKTIGGKTLKAGTDYEITYPTGRKNVGTYTIVIVGKGAYTGATTAAFKINPKGTTLLKPVKGTKAITVKWKKQTAKMATKRITGYQIQLATNSGFTKNKKTVKVAGYSKASRKVTGLKAKTRYYIRIRTYRTIDDTTYYSPWSGAKNIKTA